MARGRSLGVALTLACIGCVEWFPERPALGPRTDADGAQLDAGREAGLDSDATTDARPPADAAIDRGQDPQLDFYPNPGPDAAGPRVDQGMGTDGAACGPERCNGLDDDCDGATDEDSDERALCVAGRARCSAEGFTVCEGGVQVCNVQPLPSEPEACNGIDDDCDGVVDNGGCEEIVCAEGMRGPPCNGCPAGTVIPVDAVSGDWVCIPAGVFTLGSPADESGRADAEGPQVLVRITRPFLMQVHEVTQAQWQDIIGSFPPYHQQCDRAGDAHDRCPVERINWFGAVAYLNERSRAEGLEPCYVAEQCGQRPPENRRCQRVARVPDCSGYRLPTEAEWEYAARGGTATRFWSGDADADLERVGWCSPDGLGTHPACRLPAEGAGHPWGLCDMHGNVGEWVESWYGEYPAPPADGGSLPNPTGPEDGERRGVRGGYFEALPASCRSAARSGAPPEVRDEYTGFRAVRTVPQP